MTEQDSAAFEELAELHRQAEGAAKAMAWFASEGGRRALENNLLTLTITQICVPESPDERRSQAHRYVNNAAKRYASQIIDAAIADAKAVLAQFEGTGE